MTKFTNKGFTVVEAVLILVIVGLVGLVGYKVYSTRQSTDKANQASISAQNGATTTASVKPINDTSDLDAAKATLDQTNPDDNNADVSSLDSQSQGF